MTIVPHDHRAHGSGRRCVAWMTVVLGDSLFSSDFYCPLYPGVYRALLGAWQEYRTRWGWQALIFQAPHPSCPSLCVIRRPQGAPGALGGEHWHGVRSTITPLEPFAWFVCCPRPGAMLTLLSYLDVQRGGVQRCWLRRAAAQFSRIL